jgi:DNA-binding response OmpR family regulator
MPGKLYLIHWNQKEAEEHAQPLKAWGWEVDLEAEDGARAAKQIKAESPDVVVIYLTRLPSHGRETARYLRSVDAMSQIPIVFVDGEETAVEKTKRKVPQAIYTKSEDLKIVLVDLIKGHRSG